ncbi:hypothetical protein MKX01_005353 [Papaver californicum]|nr:hypothetical protein MKX01_005353 [Papaver californicum]
MDKGEEEEDISDLFKNIMEGFSDKVIPLLSDLITENNNKNINDENVSKEKKSTKRVKAEVYHQSLVPMEIIQKISKKSDRNSIEQLSSLEGERRNKLTEKYCVLQSLVPKSISNHRSKPDIIEETIKYIKNLEEELKELEESKKKKTKKELSKTSTNSLNSSIVDVTITGNTAFFGIQVEKINNNVEEPFLFSRVMKVFEKFKTEILTTTITTRNELKTKKMITLSVTVLINEAGGGSVKEIKKGISRLFV